MKEIILDKNKYELIREYKNGFDLDTLKEYYTDYFSEYDYIFGDYSYDKLRIKGYNDKNSKNYSKINDINTLDDYIKNYCSFECRYFLLKKVK